MGEEKLVCRFAALLLKEGMGELKRFIKVVYNDNEDHLSKAQQFLREIIIDLENKGV